MAEVKYIVIQSSFCENLIILPASMSHREVADSLVSAREFVLSAGFLSIYLEDNSIKIQCYGESETLKIKSRPIDAFLAKQVLDLVDQS